MSQIDQAFNEAITRLQIWLQFLERKAAEHQSQINRVKRTPQTATAGVTAPESEPAAAPVGEDGWQ